MWHKIEITCPQCHETLAITDIKVAADGGVRIDLNCATCDQPHAWTSDIARLKKVAADLDGLVIPTNGYSEYDIRFMQAVHFNMDDQKLLEEGRGSIS